MNFKFEYHQFERVAKREREYLPSKYRPGRLVLAPPYQYMRSNMCQWCLFPEFSGSSI